MRWSLLRLAAAAAVIATLGPPAVAAAHEKDPIVIGHRGAPGYLPDHTLEGYKLAIAFGADYIEPDLVATKDGALIARHEPMLGTADPNDLDSTNVARLPQFANRLKTKQVDGFPVRAWFADDFTLAEIRTLRARQTRGGRPTQFNDKFGIPTFQQVIDLAQRESEKQGRTIGIYPETKHPTFHEDQNLALEGRIVHALQRNGLDHEDAPVFIQSFEQSNLKKLNTITDARLVQLMDANDTDPVTGRPTFAAPFDRPYDWTVSGNPTLMNRTFAFFATNAGLNEVKTYADGIGPWKVYIIPTTGSGGGAVKPPTDLIKRAHDRGLLVHTWTFRDDAFPTGYPGGPVDEYLAFYRLGIDGVFSDFPDTAWAAREIFRGP